MSNIKKFKSTIKITSEGKNKIRVTMDYNQEAVAFFKTLASRKYNLDDKSWSFDESEVEPLINKFKQLNLHYDDDRKHQLQPKKLFEPKIKITSKGLSRVQIVMGYNKQAVNFFKTLSSRNYNTNDKTWSFHLSDLKVLLNKFDELGLEYDNECEMQLSDLPTPELINVDEVEKTESSNNSSDCSSDEDSPTQKKTKEKKKAIMRLAFIDTSSFVDGKPGCVFIDHECASLKTLDTLHDINGRTYNESLDKWCYDYSAIKELEKLKKKNPDMFEFKLAYGGYDAVVMSSVYLQHLQMTHMPKHNQQLAIIDVLDGLMKFDNSQTLWNLDEI